MTKASIQKILTAAIALIEKGWCQNSCAKINGKPCSVSNKYATEFDLLGALHRAAGSKTLWDEAIWDYFPEDIGKNPGRWNDNPKRTQEQVVTALKDALAKVDK